MGLTSATSVAYRELAPPAALAAHVACVWEQRVDADDGSARVQSVVPDACADIISIDGGPPILVGPATRTVRVPLSPGTAIVGVRFRPGAVAAAMGVAADALVDRDLPLAELWRETARLDDTLAAGGPRARLDALVRELTARVAARPVDQLARAAVAWLAARPDGSVGELGGYLELSARQLRRRIAAATGYAPKLLHRILRFQRLLVAAHADGAAPLARLAADAGYVDQAHMTHEVHALAGVTPAALRARTNAPAAMAAFYKTLGGGAGMVGR